LLRYFAYELWDAVESPMCGSSVHFDRSFLAAVPHLVNVFSYRNIDISTIKELLKLNPLFKEELQIFLSHSDFTEPGKLADFVFLEKDPHVVPPNEIMTIKINRTVVEGKTVYPFERT